VSPAVSYGTDMHPRISVLGPLTISVGEVVLKSRPAGERAVLGVLALGGGNQVPMWSVIDAVWDEEPPSSASRIVQCYVSRLRRVLGPPGGAPVLVRDGAGYRLDVTAAELDLVAYLGLLTRAHAAQADGDAVTAAGLYERAFVLWRGEPLSDVPVLREYPPLVALADRHRASVLAHAGLVAGNGQPGRALPFLRAVCASRALDEEPHAALMTALWGAGRQAEALAVYREMRQRLADQLGVDPGKALGIVHDRILRQEVPVPAGMASGSRSPFQLPALAADFTGRAAESMRLEEILAPAPGQAGVPLAVVTGPPGSGKTTLALRAAHALAAQFPDGQLWVHLAGTSASPREPGDVLGEFLRTLGMHGSAVPGAMEERAVCYRSRLVGQRVLVVADDASTAGQVRSLLPGTPGCALLVTSRSALEGLAGARLLPLEMMPAAEGTELLGRIVGPDRVAGEPQAAAALVQACGGLPLALRIAGARLAARPSWSLGLLANRITTARSKLRELESSELSVRASIASSYRELPSAEQRAFRLLAVHGSADFAEWVVAVVCGVPESEGAAILAGLTDRSLVIPLNADATGEPRYQMHDLLREFASEKLAEQDPPATVPETAERLLDAWLQLAAAADERLPRMPDFPRPHHPVPAVLPEPTVRRLTADPIAWFTAERVSLLAAVDQASRHGLVQRARWLTARQGSYQRLQYRYDDTERLWQQIAYYADRTGDEHMAQYARLGTAMSLLRQGRAADALVLLDQCIGFSEQHGDLVSLAYTLSWRATCRWDLDDFAGARSDAARGVDVARQAHSPGAEGLNMSKLGLALANSGEADQAVAAANAALEITAGVPDDPGGELDALLNAAHIYAVAGQLELAVRACSRAVELSRRLGDQFSEAEAWGKLGDANVALGRYQEGVACLSRALPVFRDRGNRRYHAVCLFKLGQAYLALESPQAADCLEESLSICGELRLPGLATRVRQALAQLPQSGSPSSANRQQTFKRPS
jgi:DNA-binding SARP family transcriptional activator/tetratricopeptide (TPR) repeat protein